VKSQLAIPLPADYSGNEKWLRKLDVIRAAVQHLNPKEVAFALDVAHTQLSDAIHGRERKVWHASWSHIVKDMLLERRDRGDEYAGKMLRQILEIEIEGYGFELEESEEITMEDENASLRRELAQFGEAGRIAASRVRRAKARAR
jgi:hypothetical protein